MSRLRKFSYVIFLKSVSYLRVSVEPNKKMLLLEVGFTEMEKKGQCSFSALRNKVSLSYITKGQRVHA